MQCLMDHVIWEHNGKTRNKYLSRDQKFQTKGKILRRYRCAGRLTVSIAHEPDMTLGYGDERDLNREATTSLVIRWNCPNHANPDGHFSDIESLIAWINNNFDRLDESDA